MTTHLDVVASSVEVDVLAADDSAELLDALSGGVAAGIEGFVLAATVALTLGRTGGFVLPPTKPADGATLAFTVLLVFFVLTESLSVSSSLSSSDDAFSLSEPEVLSGEKMLFCLLESVRATPPLPLVGLFGVVVSLSFCGFGALVGGVSLGVCAEDALVGGTLDLMLPLPGFETLVLVSPRSCCCCCG